MVDNNNERMIILEEKNKKINLSFPRPLKITHLTENSVSKSTKEIKKLNKKILRWINLYK
jgi:hypothetical protein